MDLSEIGRTSVDVDTHRGPMPPVPTAEAHERLQGLLAQVGAEIAGPLTAAIERINAFASTGRIDKAGLRALRDDVEAARQAGMIGQQLTRFTAGRIRQSHERLQLADTAQHVLALRQRETQARGVALIPSLALVEVIVDPSLLFSLLNATIDWALANTRSSIQFDIEDARWPAGARLACRFAQRPADDQTDGAGVPVPPSLDSLSWRLVEQTGWAMGLRIDRRIEAGVTVLAFEFPRVGVDEAASTLEANEGFAVSVNSQPLAGSHVLVIAARREIRMQIRESLRSMSLIVDFVNSVDEAAAFCHEGLPHAIIIEGVQSGERFAQFRREISAEVPEFVFIEIVEEGKVFQMSGSGGAATAKVGREVLTGSLPSALMFELSKGL